MIFCTTRSWLAMRKTLLYAVVLLCFLSAFVTRWHQISLQMIGARRHVAPLEVLLPTFKFKPLVIWSSDFHIGPITDLKHYLSPMGVRFIDKSLDTYRCQRTRTCVQRNSLKVIHPGNALNLEYHLIPKFYDAYRNDSEIAATDAFTCSHSTALCELYAPFNKSLILLATHRYELGRFGKERWTTWNANLIRYASQPWNVIAANNLYDVEYIKYFTGLQPLLIPSYCGYTNQVYNHSRPGFLFAHNTYPEFFQIFMNNFTATYRSSNATIEITPVRWKYGDYKYHEMAAHQGVVHVPYQVSVMSFFEQYRMNIPLFAPTRELLVELEYKYQAMRERTWDGTFNKVRPSRSAIDAHPTQRHVPDPNSYTLDSIRYWLNFTDFYQFPHVTYYSSAQDLIDTLQTIRTDELLAISDRMKEFNAAENKRLRALWKDILLRIADHSSNKPH